MGRNQSILLYLRVRVSTKHGRLKYIKMYTMTLAFKGGLTIKPSPKAHGPTNRNPALLLITHQRATPDYRYSQSYDELFF